MNVSQMLLKNEKVVLKNELLKKVEERESSALSQEECWKMLGNVLPFLDPNCNKNLKHLIFIEMFVFY